MLKQLSIKLRITILTAVVLIVCCVGLTIVLNLSASQLVLQLSPEVKGRIAPPSNVKEITIDQSKIVIEQAKHGFQKESIYYMIAIVVAGSALTYYAAGKALKPLTSLNQQVKKIHVSNLSDSLEVPLTRDEVADLTLSFNEMTDKLSEAFQIQQRFSVSAAHELRTPLAVLQTKLDVFKKKKEHSLTEYEGMLATFEKQIVRLRALVSNLLDLTYRNDEEEKSHVVVKELLEEVVMELSAISEGPNISLTLTCDDSEVYGNPDLLYRAFYNVVDNGIRYNKPSGKVEIDSVKMADGKCMILIKDTGIGIPSETKKHIFEAFYRVDKSRSRAMGGAGLGLSIVEHIVRKHHGTIEVSDRLGGGTCFKIVL